MLTGLIIAIVMLYLIYCILVFPGIDDNRSNEGKSEIKNNSKEDIVGKSSFVKRIITHEKANDNTTEKDVSNAPIFVGENDLAESDPTDNQEIPSVIVIPLEKLDEVFSTDENNDESDEYDPEAEVEIPEVNEAIPDVDWDAEEEELNKYRVADDGDINYASGISFEELNKLGTILSKDEVLADEIEEVGVTLGKISETELFDQVLSALPDAMRNIFSQIDAKVNESEEINRSRTPDWMNFDISKYV